MGSEEPSQSGRKGLLGPGYEKGPWFKGLIVGLVLGFIAGVLATKLGHIPPLPI